MNQLGLKSKVDDDPLYDNVPEEDDYATPEELDLVIDFYLKFLFMYFITMILFGYV